MSSSSLRSDAAGPQPKPTQAKRPSPSKKRKAVVAPSKLAAEPSLSVAEHRPEKLLQEKSKAYPLLWSEVLAAADARRTGLPLPVLKASFLDMDDATATSLNVRLKEKSLNEARAFRDLQDVKDEILQTLIDLVNHGSGSD